MRRRGLVFLIILVPLLAIGAESLVWLLLARQVQTAFHQWVAQRQAEGWQVSAETERLGGWPFAAVVQVDGFAISGGTNLVPGGLSWRSQRLALKLGLSSLERLVVLPSGRQRFHLFGGPAIRLSASHISASVQFAVLPFMAEPAPSRGVMVTAGGVHIGPANIDPDLVTADTVALQLTPGSRLKDQAPSEPSLKLGATGIIVDHEEVAALGPKIGVFSFSAALIHQVPGGASWISRLSAWRDQGGMVAVRSLSLVWGPLAVGASGLLTLDQKLQPAGQGTARVLGYAATLDALVGAGRIGSGVATAAKALLTLLARPSSAGGPPEVDVPLSLENRTLSLGQIPLIKLPSMAWPSGA